ncbi:Outer membrane protein assembly factor YaeT precursor [Altererythrobacter epoxidivorans]|uniref:Outer membrane protein assembly factor YaeT n=1 Tax=Altererythrobacter epoxidivorans TaxID=361183 RepID=A0A0M4LWZ4_9SPHN|nr:OmpA family protein [Altererythrobacter epoxidivorans]ALE17941.1 Outer membrane protein assembly factor YaeT precursor [Altererythrobacter epoxidivorans]
MNKTITAMIATGTLALAACSNDAPAPEPTPTPTGGETPVSILRPDVEQPPQIDEMMKLETRISFADGGSELSEEALAELATVRESPQLAEGGPIELRGHSDAGGSDDANMRASTARAEAVKEWLVEMGVAEDRITIIAFGEQNPVEPNALPDGSPNEKGRAANRRVDVTVRLPTKADAQKTDKTAATSDKAQAD